MSWAAVEGTAENLLRSGRGEMIPIPRRPAHRSGYEPGLGQRRRFTHGAASRCGGGAGAAGEAGSGGGAGGPCERGVSNGCNSYRRMRSPVPLRRGGGAARVSAHSQKRLDGGRVTAFCEVTVSPRRARRAAGVTTVSPSSLTAAKLISAGGTKLSMSFC